MSTHGKMTDLEKQKRADRREAKKNAPCPHDWRNAETAIGTCAQCVSCGMLAQAVVMQ